MWIRMLLAMIYSDDDQNYIKVYVKVLVLCEFV